MTEDDIKTSFCYLHESQKNIKHKTMDSNADYFIITVDDIHYNVDSITIKGNGKAKVIANDGKNKFARHFDKILDFDIFQCEYRKNGEVFRFNAKFNKVIAEYIKYCI